MSANPILDAAHSLAAQGLLVFRLKPRDKVPDTRHGHRDAVSDPLKVTAMFSGRPNANLGIRTGQESRSVVLDVDPRHGGDQSLAQVEAKCGALPTTVTCNTGGGGQHFYFQHPGERLASRAGVRRGLDVRGDGGYVVAPPSIHASGKPYTWVVGRAPGEVEFAPLPPALLKLMRSRAMGVEERAQSYLSKCEPAGEGERNERAFKVSGHLRALVDAEGCGLTEDCLLALVREWNSRNQPPLEDAELLRCVKNSAAHGSPPGRKLDRADRPLGGSQSEPPSFGTQGRPSLVMRAGELHRVADECVLRLARESPPLVYVHHRRLVVLVPVLGAQPIGAARPRLCVHELNESALCDVLNSRNSFIQERVNPRTGEITYPNVDCPLSLSRWLLGRGGWPGLPNLVVILTAPTMLPGGELVLEPGYDTKSGIYLDIGKDEFPSVPLAPTKTDAEQALHKHILPLYAEFPFVSEASRAVAISGLFTGVLRFAFTSAPLHCFDAPMTASGKTLIAETNGIAIQGFVPPPISFAGTDDEVEKRIASALLDGQRAAVIDNIRRPLGGDILCSAITSTAVGVRKFHTQTMPGVATWATVWSATGNNLELDKDASSRALRCRLDAGLENPATRQFQIADLRAHVLAHRGEIVTAVLTCARAYVIAGRPSQDLTPLNRFEGWSELVRGLSVWLGLADPVETMGGPEAGNAETDELHALLAGLRASFGSAEFTAASAIARPELGAVLDVVCLARSGHGYDARKFGHVLQRGKGRVVGGLRLELTSKAHGTNCYRVLEVATPSPVGGTGGMGGIGGIAGERAATSPPRARACVNTEGEDLNLFREQERSIPPLPPLPPSEPGKARADAARTNALDPRGQS